MELLQTKQQMCLAVTCRNFQWELILPIITTTASRISLTWICCLKITARQKLLQLQENYESFQLMLNQGLQKQYMHNMLQLNNGDGTFSEIAQAQASQIPTGAGARCLQILITMGIKIFLLQTVTCVIIPIKIFLRYWGDYKLKKAIDREPFN